MNTTLKRYAPLESRPRSGTGRLKAILLRWLPSGRTLAIVPPFAWLMLFFALPFVLVLKISFADQQLSVPPYTALLSFEQGVVHIALQFGHYLFLLQDDLYVATYLSSLKMAGVSTFFCLLIGYPMAYYIARASASTRNLLMMAVMLPFWTSFLIRVYAWIGILKDDGLLNHFLIGIGLIHTPLRLYHTDWGVYIGMVYSYLPFMIMPLYANLVKMDLALLEAAYDLGAKPWTVFTRITLPLSKNGMPAACWSLFRPSVNT